MVMKLSSIALNFTKLYRFLFLLVLSCISLLFVCLVVCLFLLLKNDQVPVVIPILALLIAYIKELRISKVLLNQSQNQSLTKDIKNQYTIHHVLIIYNRSHIQSKSVEVLKSYQNFVITPSLTKLYILGAFFFSFFYG